MTRGGDESPEVGLFERALTPDSRMKPMVSPRIAVICAAAALLMDLLVLPGRGLAQEEVASSFRRYKEREASTGYYEETEVSPRGGRPLVSIPGVRGGLLPYSPTAAQVRIRTRLEDSHQGIKFYRNLRCDFCHINETKDLHRVRANLTCSQCHGGEPIPSNDYFYSPLNPIRRHAYVCSKCHEGASASYAAYVVHEPNPAMVGTLKSFPILFYVFWFMVVLAVGTFLVFLPHTLMWGIREVIQKTKGKPKGESKD
jgi:hypothetical protein